MSQQDVWAVVGRAKLDGDFSGRLVHDFEGAVREAGYALSPDELQAAKAAISDSAGPQQQTVPPLQEITDGFRFQQEETRTRIKAQTARMIELNQFTVDTLKQTIGHSASTYRKITLMNQAMFWMGVSLFAFAVFYSAVFHDLQYGGAFAGLGTASFVGFFVLGPIQKTQVALSNLIQAEIAFMNYFEQMSFLENYAGAPTATGVLDPDRIEKASELLQKRSQQTIELLERYLEEEPKGRETPADVDKTAASAG
jgi:hypothetical protein